MLPWVNILLFTLAVGLCPSYIEADDGVFTTIQRLNTFLMIQDPVSTTVYLFTQKSFIKGEQN